MEISQWLEQINQLFLTNQTMVTTNQAASAFLVICYSLSTLLKFKRSWRLAVAFFVCDIIQKTAFFGLLNNLYEQKIYNLYGVIFFLLSFFVWIVICGHQIKTTKNKSLAFWCSTMVAFLLLMAWDRYVNTYTRTYIYTNYENIVVCIHICIILSLYKPISITNSMVNKLRDFFNVLRNNYAFAFFWYTLEKTWIKR